MPNIPYLVRCESLAMKEAWLSRDPGAQCSRMTDYKHLYEVRDQRIDTSLSHLSFVEKMAKH